MHFHLPTLSLLIEFRTYFQDLISGGAVFFHSEERALHARKKKRFLPDKVRVSDADNKQAIKMSEAERESLYI